MARVPLAELIYQGANPVRTAPGRSVAIYNRGTKVAATIYEAESGSTTVAQPLLTDSSGLPTKNGNQVWMIPGLYTVSVAGQEVPIQVGTSLTNVSGRESVIDAGAIPATVITDAEVGAASTALKSPGGHFTSAMTGQYFYLQKGGPVLVTGTNAWAAHPLIGTFTYVSATEGTLSVATTTAVTAGEVIIGPDCTSAVNAAIVNGYGSIPANISLILSGEPNLATGKSLVGSGPTSRLFSVTKKANVLTSAWTTGVRVEDLSIYGNGWGEQPANTDPGEGKTPNWALSGSGIIFAAVTKGKIENVRVYYCGGNAVTAERNGVAGVWTTMGCKECAVVDVHATYCRNGINEDNYFASVEHEYAPLNNTYTRPVVNYNYVGIGADSGSQSRGIVIDSAVGKYCVISGVEIHRTNFATVIAPRCENNGIETQAPGLYIHGNESANSEYQQITVVSPQCHFNGSHGIKVSEFVTNWKIVGGVVSRNQFDGIFANNKAHKGKVIGTTIRDNGLGGEFHGVHINGCTDVWILGNIYDDQEGPTQKWGVKAEGSSELIVVDDGCTFSGNSLGPVTLVGATSRVGALTSEILASRAQGLAGENFPRNSGAFASVVLATKKSRASLVGLRAGTKLTNIYFTVTVKGETLTDVRVAVWSKAGLVLAKSANLSAEFGAVGVKGGALETPLTVTEDNGYYIGILAVGTTPPGILMGTSGITGYAAGVVAGGSPPSVVENVEKTAIETILLTPTGTAPWVGWV